MNQLPLSAHTCTFRERMHTQANDHLHREAYITLCNGFGVVRKILLVTQPQISSKQWITREFLKKYQMQNNLASGGQAQTGVGSSLYTTYQFYHKAMCTRTTFPNSRFNLSTQIPPNLTKQLIQPHPHKGTPRFKPSSERESLSIMTFRESSNGTKELRSLPTQALKARHLGGSA